MNELNKYLKAGDPNLYTSELEVLAASIWPKIRIRVAEHPSSPIHVLILLAKDADPEVRMAVANNVNVTLPILEWLANDESGDVRFYLAEDPRLPRTILRKLSEDHNPFVAKQAELTLLKAAQSQLFDKPEIGSATVSDGNRAGARYSAMRILYSLFSPTVLQKKPIATYK